MLGWATTLKRNFLQLDQVLASCWVHPRYDLALGRLLKYLWLLSSNRGCLHVVNNISIQGDLSRFPHSWDSNPYGLVVELLLTMRDHSLVKWKTKMRVLQGFIHLPTCRCHRRYTSILHLVVGFSNSPQSYAWQHLPTIRV